MMNLYLRMRNALQERMERQEGAAMAEYGLLIALIAVVAVVAVAAFGEKIAAVFTDITGSF